MFLVPFSGTVSFTLGGISKLINGVSFVLWWKGTLRGYGKASKPGSSAAGSRGYRVSSVRSLWPLVVELIVSGYLPSGWVVLGLSGAASGSTPRVFLWGSLSVSFGSVLGTSAGPGVSYESFPRGCPLLAWVAFGFFYLTDGRIFLLGNGYVMNSLCIRTVSLRL